MYSLCMEDMKDTLPGSFEPDANVFRKHCGTYLAKHATLEVDVRSSSSKHHYHVGGCAKEANAGMAREPIFPPGPAMRFDDKEVVYKRRNEARLRHVALPNHVLHRWCMVSCRITFDVGTSICIANEIVRGVDKKELFRALPAGANKINTIAPSDINGQKNYKNVLI